jgi:hypothetical protein
LHFLLCIISPSVAGIILLVHQCKSWEGNGHMQ